MYLQPLLPALLFEEEARKADVPFRQKIKPNFRNESREGVLLTPQNGHHMIIPDPKVDPPLRDQLHVLHNPSPQCSPTQPIGRIITLLRAVKADHQRWGWTLHDGTLLHWGGWQLPVEGVCVTSWDIAERWRSKSRLVRFEGTFLMQVATH